MNRSLFCSVVVSACIVSAVAPGSDWPQFRGPDGTGFVAEANPPLTWSDTENVKWKVEIPGKGYASPIIVGDRIYLLTAVDTGRAGEGGDQPQGRGDAEGDQDRESQRGSRGRGRGRRGPQPPSTLHQFIVMALDRADGATIWSTTVNEEVPHEGVHPTSTFASASPVTDGERIIASFGSRGLYCLDMSGTVLWQHDLGDMSIRLSFGEGSTPVLHGDTVVVSWDHEGDDFIAAFDAATGEEKWRTGRDEPSGWSTPVVAEVNGSAQVILANTNASVAYDLATGAEIWRCRGMTSNVIPTPIVAHGMVFLMSGFRGSMLQAVNLSEARGDITDTDAVVWSHGRATPYTPSGMLAGGNLYFLGSNNGMLSCLDAMTGQVHYLGERLGSVRNVYASIVGAGDYVYVCGREGNTAVIESGPEFKLLGTNSLGEGINATPAIVGDELYIRGDRHLFCIAESGD